MVKIIPREQIRHLEWNAKQSYKNGQALEASKMDHNIWKYVKTGDVSNNPYLKDTKKDKVMSEKNVPVNIENVQNVEINIFNSSPDDDIITDISHKPEPPEKSKTTLDNKTRFQSIVEITGKIISIISGVAVVVFVVLLWLGITTIGEIQIGKLFTVFSFTLFSSLISIGGVRMFTLSASLRKANEKIENYIIQNGGCPFYYVVDDKARLRYEIKSAYIINDKKWCNGCFLVDHNGHTDCKYSPFFQRLTSNSS